MTEVRRIISELAPALAQSMRLWRDAAVALLALVVLVCVWFAASVYGEP